MCVTCESVCGSWDFERKEYDYMIFFFFFFFMSGYMIFCLYVSVDENDPVLARS